MFRFLLLVVMLGISPFSSALAQPAVGYRELDIADPVGERPLRATLWYPAIAQGKPETIGEDEIFYGVKAYRAAPIAGEAERPLILLSHGFNGSWRNLSWLAVRLAEHGYVVAVPNHPGTSVMDMNPVETGKLWERPHDISRLIDALLADTSSLGPIDSNRIFGIGHSLGAWTMVALAGGRFDARRFATECHRHFDPFTCGLSQRLGISTSVEAETPLSADMSDPRIGAFVTLDVGMARGFTPDSLARISKPFLIVNAGTESGGLPAQLESGYLAQHLPSDRTQNAQIPDAMHFSFTQRCKPDAEKLLSKNPDDVILCRDGGTVGRAAIHDQVIERILQFLAKASSLKTFG